MRTSDRPAADGFTLVELLIVLTIIGLMSAAVVVAMPDTRGSLRGEAERFAARARAAQERALIGGRAVSISIEADGYRFAQRKGQDWQPFERPDLAAETWTEGTTGAAEPQSRIVFDSTGAADPARLVLRRAEEEASVEIGADGSIRVVL